MKNLIPCLLLSGAILCHVQVEAQLPPQPGPISGPTYLSCLADNLYTIYPVVGAITHNWSLSGGGNIVWGNGSNNIKIDWTAVGIHTVNAWATNSFGNSPVRSLTVVVYTIPAPDPITGATSVTCPTSNMEYAIPGITGALSHFWSVSGGGTIVSGNGSDIIQIDWTSSGTHTVSAWGNNLCGDGPVRSLNVTVNGLPLPGPISGPTYLACVTDILYSIDPVVGAITHNWSLSGGGNIVWGNGSNIIKIDWTTVGTHTVNAWATNSFGNSPIRTLSVEVHTIPAPDPITGAASVTCPASNVGYSIPGVAGALSHFWSVSGGGIIVSGNGSDIIQIDWSTAGVHTVNAWGNNLCGDGPVRSLNVTVNGLPAPGSISGPTSVSCPPSTVSYSIALVAGAISHNWSLSGGGNIVSGNGSNNISVQWTSTGTHTLSAWATNSCGSGPSSTASVNVQSGGLPIPDPISGATSVTCPVSGEVYSIPSIAGALSHFWSVSSGGTIVSGNGSNIIQIDWTSTGTHTVNAWGNNACGDGPMRSLNVTVSGLPAPGPISGSTAVTCLPTTVSYSIAPVAGAISHNWSLSGGGNIVSGNGSNNITLQWTSAGTHTVSAWATNSCGSGPSSTASVNVQSGGLPSPGVISGSSLVCLGDENVLYSIIPIPGAISHQWSVSGGGVITSGNGSEIVTINWNSVGAHIVSAWGENSCGSGVVTTLSVTVNPLPVSTVSATNESCPGAADGTATVIPSGGTPPYSFQWDTNTGNQMSQTATGLNGGSYCVSVVDSEGCVSTLQ